VISEILSWWWNTMRTQSAARITSWISVPARASWGRTCCGRFARGNSCAPEISHGRYLKGDLSVAIPKTRIKPDPVKGWLEVIGARENNLKNITARFPIGTLTCVTGVSGSGKSTLVMILSAGPFSPMVRVEGTPRPPRRNSRGGKLSKIIVIDQTPIGRTPRSNPATYTGMFNHIRDLFARLPTAKIRGYGPSRFSFNVKGGRCEKCQGMG